MSNRPANGIKGKSSGNYATTCDLLITASGQEAEKNSTLFERLGFPAFTSPSMTRDASTAR